MQHTTTLLLIALWIWAPLLQLRAAPWWALSGNAVQDISIPETGTSSPGTAGLLAWWSFDDSAYSTLDSSANGRSLSPSGTPLRAIGKKGQSLLIDNTNDWYFRTDESWMTPTTGLTICTWVRPTDSTTLYSTGLVSHSGDVSAERSWDLAITSAGLLRFRVTSDGTTFATVNGTEVIPNLTWSFIVATWEPTNNISVYYNGALQSTSNTSIPTNLRNSTTTLRVGSYNDEGTNSTLGQHDEVVLYSRSLSIPEILYLYNNGNGRAFSEL